MDESFDKQGQNGRVGLFTGGKVPFDLWLTRSLRSLFDPVLHEPLPAELIALVPSNSRPAGRAKVARDSG